MTSSFEAKAGRKQVIHWRLRRHIYFIWEFPCEVLEPLLPQRLSLVETRPGVGLVSVGALHYEPGHFGPDSPVFDEIVCTLQVHSDLSLPMPQPKWSVFGVSVFSNSSDFVVSEGRTIYTPTLHQPTLQLDFADNGLAFHAKDANGPIMSLASTHTDATFVQREYWGQHFEDHERGFFHGVWQWDGGVFEHMKPGHVGKLYPHPFFRKLDVTRALGCYRQMFAGPGPVNQRFFEPWTHDTRGARISTP